MVSQHFEHFSVYHVNVTIGNKMTTKHKLPTIPYFSRNRFSTRHSSGDEIANVNFL